MRILLLLIFVLALAGCASNPEIKTVTIEKTFTPHLWSDHKELNESVEMCAIKGESILSSLGFKSVVKNGNYVYGNFNDNRAAIKCVKVSGKTFVYVAVAGPEVKLVEKLRNEIVWKL